MRVKKRSWILLGAALALTITAALLSGTDKEVKTNERQVKFPTYYSEDETLKRVRREQPLQLRVVLDEEDTSSESVIEEWDADPLLVALSGAAARSDHFVFDLASLSKTPIGQIIVDCMSEQDRNPIGEFAERAGRSPLEVIERMAVTDDVIFVDGDFEGVDLLALFDDEDLLAETTGSITRFYRQSAENAVPPDTQVSADVVDTEPNAAPERRLHAALWNNAILMVAEKKQGGVEEAIGILEGTIPYDESVFPEREAYGDMFGRLSIDEAAEMFSKHDAFAQRFSEVVDDVYLHIDASEDVAIVADALGNDETAMNDLAVSLGGILSVARLTARADGNEELHELLDFASVGHSNNGFELSLALPLPYLEAHLADCKWMHEGE